VDDAGEREQRREGRGRPSAIEDQQHADRDHRQGDERFGRRKHRAGEMQRRAGQRAGDQRDEHPQAARDEGEQEPRGDDEGEMIGADDRVADAGKKAFQPRARQAPAHEMMRLGERGQNRERSGQEACEARFHDFFFRAFFFGAFFFGLADRRSGLASSSLSRLAALPK
jgi:hypothetical protein